MKAKYYAFLGLVSAFLFSGCATTGYRHVTSESCVASYGEHVLYGYPSDDCIILNREGYTLCHDNQKKVADWVSYHLTDAYLVKNAERSDDFRADPDLPVGQRSELEDYAGSGYDRGHLAPAGDMTRSQKVMSESFLLSNMAPQVGVGFNRDIWKSLEEKVRGWVKEKKNIYVITGPIYSSDDYDTIGQNKVAVPSSFYKIIIFGVGSGKDIDAIAFILPNKKNSSSDLPKFITSIDEIEKETGLDFLHDLDDVTENSLEAKIVEMW